MIFYLKNTHTHTRMTIKLLGISKSDKRSMSVCLLWITLGTRFVCFFFFATAAMVAIWIDRRLESIIDTQSDTTVEMWKCVRWPISNIAHKHIRLRIHIYSDINTAIDVKTYAHAHKRIITLAISYIYRRNRLFGMWMYMCVFSFDSFFCLFIYLKFISSANWKHRPDKL